MKMQVPAYDNFDATLIINIDKKNEDDFLKPGLPSNANAKKGF
jgi:hypothetical protein